MLISQMQPRPDFVEVLEQLYRERSLTSYTAGQSIPLRASEILIVCRGVIQLFTIQPDGSETLLGLAGPSSPMGLPLTTVDPYWADALTDADILSLSMAEIESSPILMAGLFRRMARRLQQSEAWLALSGKRLVGDRLRHLLMLIADEFGQADERGIRINIRLTHHQLAAAIGTTRVTVTRLLKDFKTEGWLTTHQRFLILTPPVSGFAASRLVS
ncbi:MAG: Crp/Fnr family transcriptional regulator [Leptolyngbyaceae cyanobacterium SM1_1_3]|nr:Crp/Fnr family transcriptional regulator [Leptolyngbyaceae cyanobacterium SM1_1_3]NJN04326.1 Crp/Fnr family transcriptional regulator [Leptolyngbyaceae cyanobacterium RM1_1_2]NJO12091.1 Crp/Fnr family transcriptional regulator [Leptolyngbyaceae cyanobacterium SL_1_1]